MLQLRAKNMPLRSEYIFPIRRGRKREGWRELAQDGPSELGEVRRLNAPRSLRHSFTHHTRTTAEATLYSNGARRRRERGKCRFRKIYLNRRGQLNCGRKRKRKREEGTCVRNVLVNCFKRRHSIFFNFENNSRRRRSVLPLRGEGAQRVDLGADKSVHCSLPVYRVAQVHRL